MKEIYIHTDGACSGNPGPGGWAAVMVYAGHRRELSGAEPETTNNRMELRAVIEALRTLKEPCQVVLATDSKYVHSGITEWMPNWKRKNWRTANKEPVKNQDLWLELDAQNSRHLVTWKWVKGHAGNGENERCDELAVAAIRELGQNTKSAPKRGKPAVHTDAKNTR